MTAEERLELIRRYQAGEATADEVRQLEQLLEADPQLRQEYLAYARLDAGLSVVARRHRPAAPQPRRWLAWRPATAAAAGLMVGVLSASVAWAFAVPIRPESRSQIVPIIQEGFEDPLLHVTRGFPSGAGVWSGDLSDGIAEEQGVTPLSGERMVQLPPPVTRKFSYAWRIIDLSEHPIPPGDRLRRVEVEASFHDVPGDPPGRHQIRLAAFAEEPAAVRAIWNRSDMFDHVLLHVGRTVASKTPGWHTLRSSMEIPPGARSLVISVAAASADGSAPKVTHYLDDVRVQFVTEDTGR